MVGFPNSVDYTIMKKIRWFATHPIQYQTPLMKELADKMPLDVAFFQLNGSIFQKKAGFDETHDWGVDLLENLPHLSINSTGNSTQRFFGLRANWISLWKAVDPSSVKGVIVNGWFPWCYIQVWLVCILRGVPFIVRGDSTLQMDSTPVKRKIKAVLFPLLFRFPEAFAFVGERNRQFYRHFNVAEKRLFPAFHCVNSAYLQPNLGKKKGNRFGFIGKHIAIKNVPLILDLFSSKEMKDCELFVAGDGPLSSQLKDKYCGFSNIHWMGFLKQTELTSFFDQIDMLLLPSKSETWGLVVNEAFHCGVPAIVSSNVGCGDDLITPGVTGYVFESENGQDLQKCILDFKKSTAPFAGNVVEKVIEYSQNQVVANIERFWKSRD
ncbi:MAG: glycosyltransferase involved in cell wall biosynthesis [Luteibaculaceae bacterium]|jgi:glycosyltransferase involved in cell wall biosynthesis